MLIAGVLSLGICISIGTNVTAAETSNSSESENTSAPTDYEKMQAITNFFHNGEKPIKEVVAPCLYLKFLPHNYLLLFENSTQQNII
jgi:hypothetical protein